MALLLLHDISDPSSTANPAVKLDNPCLLFARKAAHSGLLRYGPNLISPRDSTYIGRIKNACSIPPRALPHATLRADAAGGAPPPPYRSPYGSPYCTPPHAFQMAGRHGARTGWATSWRCWARCAP